MGAVAYKKRALKGLRRMPKSYADNFRNSFTQIAESSDSGLDIKALQGRDGYRLRIGCYRAIFEKEGEDINVLVLDAGPRGDIYK